MAKSETKVKVAAAKTPKIATESTKKSNGEPLKTKGKTKEEAIKTSEEEVIVAAKTVTAKLADDDKTADGKTHELSIEKKLIALYSLQQIDTEVDKIRIIRGELPLEVQDLEDEIAGLQTRIENYQTDIDVLQTQLNDKSSAIVDHKAMIKKYESQQMNVRNNREYDAITKEIEYQNLEIQLCDKRIREFTSALEVKKEAVAQSSKVLEERTADFNLKQSELIDIVNETEKEEGSLSQKSLELQKYIEPRLLNAYTRIRNNARNGLAVVLVERDACGGCFSKIPPQRQLDIRMHKKIIVCEYCGRILVDEDIAKVVNK